MNTRTSKIIRYSLSACLAIVLLYFSFRGVDWNDFWDVLRQCSWFYVVLSMCAGLAGFVIRALRWRLLLLPLEPDIRFISCYDGFTIGRLADFALPHVGEFVRCGYVRRGQVTFDKALGTVVLERSWDILSLAFLLVLVLVFKWDLFGAFFMERIMAPVSDAFNISIWGLSAIFIAAAGAAVWCFLRLRGRRSGRFSSLVQGLVQGVSSCLKMKRKWLFLFYTFLLWLSFVLTCWFMMQALPTDYGFSAADALFLTLVGSIAGIVPVPGGFGAFHYLVALAVQTLYGLPFDVGIILATLTHEAQAVTMAAAGAVSYLHQTLRGVSSQNRINP